MGATSVTINFDSVPPWVKGAGAAFGGAVAGVLQEAMTAEHFNWSPESLKHTVLHAVCTGVMALMLYFVAPPKKTPNVTETITKELPPTPPTPPAGGQK
jgi:hypothetical protein